MTQATMDTVMKSFGKTFKPQPKKDVCHYCKGAGFELINVKLPDLYGPDAAPVEYAEPCRVCQGKRSTYKDETKSRLNLPYDAFLSAFNPSLYKDADGKFIDFKKQYNFVVGYVEKFRQIQDKVKVNGLYISSKTGGTGKTFLASIICNEIYSRYQIMPVYVTENTLLDEIEKVNASTAYTPREIFKKAQLLFIDDMWRKRTGRDWVIDELFGIIDYRYTHGLCTIITSNVGLDEPKIDKRIAGRLNEMCAWVKMPEAEIRGFDKSDDRKKLMDIINGD